MRNSEIYKRLNEQEIRFILRSFNTNTSWTDMCTEHILNPEISIMELATKHGYNVAAANEILQKCKRNIRTYIHVCGYKFEPTVDDDILMLQLPTPVHNALKRYGVPSIEVLRLMDNEQLISIRGVGVYGVNAINESLVKFGFDTNSRKYESEE